MTIALLQWPTNAAPRSVAVNPVNQAVVGAPTLDDRVQVWQNDAGYWDVELRGIPIGGIAKVNAYRALLTAAAGGAAHILIPVWDHEQAPWPSAGGREGNQNAGQFWNDGANNETWTGGYRWYDPAIRIYLDAAAALRDTTITVATTAAGTVTKGMRFSLLGQRLHEITAVHSATSWSVWPPLRRDYPTSVRCEFDRPMLRVQLKNPRAGLLDLERGIFDYTNLSLREAFL